MVARDLDALLCCRSNILLHWISIFHFIALSSELSFVSSLILLYTGLRPAHLLSTTRCHVAMDRRAAKQPPEQNNIEQLSPHQYLSQADKQSTGAQLHKPRQGPIPRLSRLSAVRVPRRPTPQPLIKQPNPTSQLVIQRTPLLNASTPNDSNTRNTIYHHL